MYNTGNLYIISHNLKVKGTGSVFIVLQLKYLFVIKWILDINPIKFLNYLEKLNNMPH